MTLTRDNFTGPWAGLPVAWTENDEFDETVYRGDVARCCQAGVPGVYSGGTTGEFYAMEFDEFKAVARATVEECKKSGTPSMIGCTSTYTLGVIRRARYAAELGADAIQVALPYWMEIGDEDIVPFFKEVAAASNGMALSIYETLRAKKSLSLEQHLAIKDAVPNYLMVKANGGTLGCTPEGCKALSQFVNVFVGEKLFGSLGRAGAKGSCSAMVYYNPRVILELWSQVEARDWKKVDETCGKLEKFIELLVTELPPTYTDTTHDRIGGVACGFLKTSLRSRGPYPAATQRDVETYRRWFAEHFPEMVQL